MENSNPKHNPYTTIPGLVLLLITASMLVVKYILPAFMVLKQPIEYPWYMPVTIGGGGLLLVYMTDDYFAQMFSVGKNYVSKKTTTTTETKTESTDKPIQ
jgi:hypothetical protein